MRDFASDSTTDEAPPSHNAVYAAIQFLRVLRRHRQCVVVCLLLAGAVGAAYYMNAPRIYESRASVLVTQTGSDVWSASMTADGPRTNLIPTYETLFSSDVILEGALDLLEDLPDELLTDFRDLPRPRHIEVLQRNLRAAGVRNTNVIEISYRATSPEAAAAIVDAIVQSYLSYMAEKHKSVSVEIVGKLDDERVHVQEQYRQKEAELVAARSHAGDLGLRSDSRQIHPIVERAISINQTLVTVQSERLQLEASLAAIRDTIRAGGNLQQHLAAIEPLLGRDLMRDSLGLNPFDQRLVPELETRLLQTRAKRDMLLEHYGPNHPEVVEVEQTIHNTEQYLADYSGRANQRFSEADNATLGASLLGLVGERLARTKAYEAELTRHYGEVEAEAIKLNDRFMAVSLLEHELERLRQLYETLLNQIASIDMQQNQSDVRISTLDLPKIDGRPVSPRLRLVALLCLLAGTAAGAVFAYVLDLLDDRFRSPEEIREELDTPILAVIPLFDEVPSATGGMSPEGRTFIEHEAFRTLRTTLSFAGDERQRLVVSSTEPGDGKTTVISHLAASFGQIGKRTLLIDADLRKPGLSKLFRMRGQYGLSEVLRSSDDIGARCAEAVRPNVMEGVDLLPCGAKPSDPLELLGRPRFEDLIGWAESRYDQVLIDTPPVLAASDAAVAARCTDGVMLVVQPAKNHRRLVIRAVDDLRAMRAVLIGVVANQIDADEDEGYYGYGYGYGYGEDDADETGEEPDERLPLRRAA